jgi:putative thiamine transport system ATP-binding protein
LLLLDESVGKLDTALREDFRRWVFEHALRLGLPTLMVTHDAADAEAAAGRTLVL